jgi:WXG100 family type VII secretion target
VTSGVTQTQASSTEMARVSGNFETVSAELTETLSKLIGQLSHLQTAWVGSGGRAFEDVKTRYEADLKKLNQALLQTAEAIKTSGASYESTDTTSASAITKAGGSGLNLPL